MGHETDVTLADLVADVRAATPSHAAELAVPRLVDVEALLARFRGRLDEKITQRLNVARLRMHEAQKRLGKSSVKATTE